MLGGQLCSLTVLSYGYTRTIVFKIWQQNRCSHLIDSVLYNMHSQRTFITIPNHINVAIIFCTEYYIAN